MPTLPTTLAGRYRLVSLLGEGGMGRVWAAHDELLDREVAVKEVRLPPGLSAAERAELGDRMLHEARAITRINHPNVVRVIDVLHERGQPWIVMELVASRSLVDVVRQDGPLAPRRAAEIGVGVLSGLRAAHAAGVLHRDVKPANVLVADDGRVVLTDFGLALVSGDSSVTATGVVVGSPSYLAPERALDEPVIGAAADLWSLGATLYAAVEGRPPYSKSSQAATLAALAGDELPRPPARAGALRPLLEALLQKDPERRVDAGIADRMLRAVAAGEEPVGLAPVSAGQRRHAVTIGAAVAVVLLGSVGLGVLASGNSASDALSERSVGSPSASVSTAFGPSGASPSRDPLPSVFPTRPTPVVGDRNASGAQNRSVRTDRPQTTSTRRPSTSRTSGGAKMATPVTTITENRWFKLVNSHSKRCVDIRDGNAVARESVQQFACHPTGAQLFRFTFTDGGYLRIGSQLDTKLHLDVTDESRSDNAPIQLWPYNGKQQWRAVSEGNGYFHFVNRFSGKCLDVPNAQTSNWVQLVQFSCNGTGAQSFQLQG